MFTPPILLPKLHRYFCDPVRQGERFSLASQTQNVISTYGIRVEDASAIVIEPSGYTLLGYSIFLGNTGHQRTALAGEGLLLINQVYSGQSQLIGQHIGKLLIGQSVKCLIIPMSKIVAIPDARDVTNNYGVDVIGHAIITHICARLMQKLVHTVPVLLVEAK